MQVVSSMTCLGVWRVHVSTLRVLKRGLVMAVAAIVLLAGPQPTQAFECDSAAADESGAGATATGSVNNFACGPNANASGDTDSKNTATGAAANASGGNSTNIATGAAANASGANSRNIATGVSANASGDGGRNIATGVFANAAGNNSFNIATGFYSSAEGGALGNSHNIAIGAEASANGGNTNNTAVGFSSVAMGLNASAFGAVAKATHANSAAFGQNATTARDNQQVFGTATNTYTMPGITSPASKAAQTGTIYVVTSDTDGNLATRTLVGPTLAAAEDLRSQLAALQKEVNELRQRVQRLELPQVTQHDGAPSPVSVD